MKETAPDIVDRMLLHARENPERTAFIMLANDECSGQQISWHELVIRVSALASLLSNSLPGNKRVLLIYQDTLEFIIAFMGCLYAGVIPVPVPYLRSSRQMSRLHNIIEDAQVSALLTTRHLSDHLSKTIKDITFIYTDTNVPDSTLFPRPAANETAFIQYTSGSTGIPKGAVISAVNLLHNEQLIQNVFGCDKDAVILSWLPFHHDMGLIGNILHAVYVGCVCIIMSPLHFIQAPASWLRAISKYKVTHSGGPNFAYDLCVDKVSDNELQQLDLSAWKVAYNGSEVIKQHTLQRFSSRFSAAGLSPFAISPCYGLAEATLLVSAKETAKLPLTIYIHEHSTAGGNIIMTAATDPRSQSLVSSGKIAEGANVKIISLHHAAECAELEEGEICIAGESVTAGYWNKDNTAVFYELNGEKFLRTGDLGFFYQQELFVHGRLTEMLISRGRNIYPYDIEDMISKSFSAIEANGLALFCVNNVGDEWVVVAEIKRTSLRELDTTSLISKIDNLVLGSFGVCLHDIILTTPMGIPRTTSGKLQRLKCKEMFLQATFTSIAAKSGMPAAEEVPVAPALPADVSMYLANLIRARNGSLQTEQLNDQMELTDIGIDSLRATELINSINKELGINIDISTVLQDNSFSGLVNIIENMLWLKNDQTFGEEITI